MLKIKLDRIGKKGQPQYHVVVVEDKTNSGTRPVDQIGYYNPLTANKEFRLDVKAFDSWVAKGARPTDTVASLAKRNSKVTKVEAPKPVKKSTSSRAKSRDLDSSTTVGMT